MSQFIETHQHVITVAIRLDDTEKAWLDDTIRDTGCTVEDAIGLVCRVGIEEQIEIREAVTA